MDSNPGGPEDTGAAPKGSNRLGTISGTAGIVAFVVFFLVTRGLGVSVAIGAILLGFLARSQARSHHLRTGMANVGIICGILLSALYPVTLYLDTIWPV